MLSHLKVRTKLLATLVPLLIGMGSMSAVVVYDRMSQRSEANRSLTLASTAEVTASLVHELQAERLMATAAQNGSAEAQQSAAAQAQRTNAAVAVVRANLDGLGRIEDAIGPRTGASWADQLRRQLDAVAAARKVFNPTNGSAAAVTDAYTSMIDQLVLAQSWLVRSATYDRSTSSASLHWLTSAQEADAKLGAEVTTLIAATEQGRLAEVGGVFDDVRQLRDRSVINRQVFAADTDEFGRQVFDALTADAAYSTSERSIGEVVAANQNQGLFLAQDAWLQVMTGRLESTRRAESALIERVVAAASDRAADLEQQVRLFVGGTASVMLLALLLAATVTRTIVTSVGRLTRAARSISQVQLPKLVDSLAHPDREQHFELTQIDVRSQDEFAELGKAFSAVENAAIEVAAQQLDTMRKGISEIFVNLARRNQSLLDRQIEFIDRLEANEEDPDQLENLFKLDHLATRMRRNAESLLVLAGAEAPRRRQREVAVADLIRVAVGEVEDFARVNLIAVEEANVVGPVAVDVAHLLSELMENGAQYSAPNQPVEVVGHRSGDGSYVISVSDHGVGMSPEATAKANEQLSSRPALGLSLSRSLGFVVVATLARRHGITVELMPSPSNGVSAVVTLPSELIVGAGGADSYDASGDPLATLAPNPAINELLPPIVEPADGERFDWSRADATALSADDRDEVADWKDTPAFTPVTESIHDSFRWDDPWAQPDDPTVEPVSFASYEFVPDEGAAALDQRVAPEPTADPEPEPTVARSADQFGAEPVEASSFQPDSFEASSFQNESLVADSAQRHPVEPEALLSASLELGSESWFDELSVPAIEPTADHGDRLTPLLGDAETPLFDTATIAHLNGPNDVADQAAAPLLPRRERSNTVAPRASASDHGRVDRVGAPNRPPDEVRSILSRYRSGLQTGRDQAPMGDVSPTTENTVAGDTDGGQW